MSAFNLSSGRPAPRPADELSELRSTLLGYCLVLTGSKWEAEDLVQDVCLKTLPVLQGAKHHENIQAYLFRAARNQWIDRVRRQKVFDRKTADLQHEYNLKYHFGSDQDDISNVLRLVLLHVPPLQRCIFLLRDVLSYTSREVAEKLNMTEGAVKSALFRARASLVPVKRILKDPDEMEACDDDSDYLAARIQQYLLALRHENADLLVQLLHNDSVDPQLIINMVRGGTVQHGSAMKPSPPKGRSVLDAVHVLRLSA
ncbi:RNA polymerase sigma factor [Paenibacillus sp. YPG26]|uniref:RNA polymerase sigma factor n=1 Tax=Paenibacillus sp. YPG26 TaxID=2878915 RepID=UPI002041F2C5|nr:RNA polymerase sigma factor [Paenibacillus sp. YPG26]USB31900.1 RNA polymerase sigma factor [Paenibacillus sp. YPG26]